MATKRTAPVQLVVVLLLGLAAATEAWQANPKIAPRDELMITVIGVPQLTGKYPVAVDGTIEFPQLGRLKVADVTVREASDNLTKRLKEKGLLTNPQVSVELTQNSNKKVFVNGQVRVPGAVAYGGEIRLLEAITRAGGRLPDAADEVRIIRSEPETGGGATGEVRFADPIEINLRELESGNLSKNIVLQDGDQVFVVKAQAVTIVGFVRAPGNYFVESGWTVEQALAAAGGVSERGSDRRIQITRKENGKPVDVKGVSKATSVKPGDIIRVGAKIM